ncbi:hypothetical protein C8A00DRAFT_33473 [Chaetomidium leptoderma]|uniref:Uncharacterized protein n=1 Tax=Chaetomidium leptoderma TaxID=669021 RepID=A0AAN6ZXD3_9PEZI|nr:hypothetical protein C8A00DRAFT_33473 [Chaetomidium leptoderma]
MPPKSKSPVKAPKSKSAESSPSDGDAPTTVLTPRENTILLQSLLASGIFAAGNFQVDKDKVAKRMSINPRSVGNAWAIMRKKIVEFDKSVREAKGLPTAEEEAAAEAAKADPAEDGNPSPKKRARTSKTAAAGTAKSAGPGKATAAAPTKTRRGRGSPLADVSGGDGNAAGEKNAESTEEEADEEAKSMAGMAKPEPVVDENGVES